MWTGRPARSLDEAVGFTPEPLPRGDDARELVEPLACGVRAALRRLPQPGESVLVLGCGMIGLATAIKVVFDL